MSFTILPCLIGHVCQFSQMLNVYIVFFRSELVLGYDAVPSHWLSRYSQGRDARARRESPPPDCKKRTGKDEAMCCHKPGVETEKTLAESPCKAKCVDVGSSLDSSDSSDDSDFEVKLCKPAGKGKPGADDSSAGHKKGPADDAQSDIAQQDQPSAVVQQVPRVYYATRTHSQIAQVLSAIGHLCCGCIRACMWLRSCFILKHMAEWRRKQMVPTRLAYVPKCAAASAFPKLEDNKAVVSFQRQSTIAQVVRELKRTCYKPTMAILVRSCFDKEPGYSCAG